MSLEPAGGPPNIPEPVEALKASYRAAVAEATRRILGGDRSAEAAEELAIAAVEYADREVEAWRGRPESPRDLACRAGCSHCCHVPVALTIPEAIRLAWTILDGSSPDELAEFRDRVEAAHRARIGLAGRPRARLPHPCPLLDREGRCSAYEVRPLTCRGWSSRDVTRCESFHEDPAAEAAIPIDGVQQAIAQGIAFGIQGGLRLLGLGYRLIDLVEALRILLDDPAAMDRWAAGEDVFGGAELARIDPEVDEVETYYLGPGPGRPVA